MIIKRKTAKSSRGKIAKKAAKGLKKAKTPLKRPKKTVLKRSKVIVKKIPKAVVKPSRDNAALELMKRREEQQRALMQRIAKVLSESGVRQNLIGIGGENALAIVRNFYGNCSDEELAKRLKIKISDVRATLNKLHNEGLVNYIREKDSDTGWYSYSWSLNHGRMEKWAASQLNGSSPHGIDGMDYYFCPSCGTSSITNFESATDTGFRCENCNRMLEFIDEKKMAELYEKK